MKFNILLLPVFAATLIASNALAEPPIVIKFSHVVASETQKGKAAERFKQLAEKATDGRVRIELYPNSSLYKDREELEALQLGAVQMLAPSLSKFGPLGIKEFEVFDLPFIFPGKDVLYRVTEGPLGRALLKKLETKGITGLAYWDNGFKIMSANRPLRTPADFKGLRMRIQPSKVLDLQMRALGAIPLTMAFSDVYAALRSGVVDGTENAPSNLYSQKMHEVQKHVTVSDHGYLGYAVIVNKKFWAGLPNDIRTALEVSMKEASRHANATAQMENDRALEAVKKSGTSTVYVLTDRERAQWRKVLLPIYKEVEKRTGKDVIDTVRNESAKLGYK